MTLIEPKFGPWGPDLTPKVGLVWSFFLDLSLILKSDSSFGHTNPICDPEGPPNRILDPEDPIQPDSILWDMNNLYFRSVIKSIIVVC